MEAHIRTLYSISRSNLGEQSTELYELYQCTLNIMPLTQGVRTLYRLSTIAYRVLSGLTSMLRLIPSGAVYDCSSDIIDVVLENLHAYRNAYHRYIYDIPTLCDSMYPQAIENITALISDVIGTIPVINSGVDRDWVIRQINRPQYSPAIPDWYDVGA